MDQIDKMIINSLRNNCRVSLETLAQECGITANAVKRRIEKLVDLGVIDRFVLKLSLDMIDGVYLIGKGYSSGRIAYHLWKKFKISRNPCTISRIVKKHKE